MIFVGFSFLIGVCQENSISTILRSPFHAFCTFAFKSKLKPNEPIK